MKKLLVAVLLPLSIAIFLASPLQASDIDVPHETSAPAAQPVIPYSDAQQRLLQAVSADFGDIPQMVGIIRCESRFRQFDEDGQPLISPTDDVGVAQISIKVWGEKAKELGLDIYNSASDNLAMARYVYEHQGLSAWACYNKG